MTAGYGMVGQVLPPSRRVRRWCEYCKDFTWSVMIGSYEDCEFWERSDHPQDDDDFDWDNDEDEDEDD